MTLAAAVLGRCGWGVRVGARRRVGAGAENARHVCGVWLWWGLDS